jgi:hypothetical protein
MMPQATKQRQLARMVSVDGADIVSRKRYELMQRRVAWIEPNTLRDARRRGLYILSDSNAVATSAPARQDVTMVERRPHGEAESMHNGSLQLATRGRVEAPPKPSM